VSVPERVEACAQRAYQAAGPLATTSTAARNALLTRAAALLRERTADLVAANAQDMEAGERNGLSSAMLDRLLLTAERIDKIAVGVEEIVDLPDPLGRVLEEWTRPNGMHLQKVSVPLGLIGIIYESRPNVTVDAAALCLKAGNTVLLRGGSEALSSNLALAGVLREALEAEGLPASCVEILDFTDHAAVPAMASLDQYLSLIVPRGGHALIRAVVENATVPVIKHDRGMTQIYVDATCDLDMTISLVHNSKVQRPGVCNAVENLYVHRDNPEALRALVADLQAAAVEIRGCPRTCELVPGCVPATAEDFDTEYLDLILSVKVVASLDEALAEIAAHTSHLTEAICTADPEAAERFLREVDSACVYHNVSTRFTDGGQFGLGAEIGVSTDKIHARGPMGVRELTSYKYLIRGAGQIRTS